MIWNEYIECSSRDAIMSNRNKGLRKMVQDDLYFNVPFTQKIPRSRCRLTTSKALKTCTNYLLPTNKICATTILWDCSPYRNRKLCACTLRAAQLANLYEPL